MKINNRSINAIETIPTQDLNVGNCTKSLSTLLNWIEWLEFTNTDSTITLDLVDYIVATCLQAYESAPYINT